MKKLLTFCIAIMVAAGCFSCGRKTDAPPPESAPAQAMMSLRSANIDMAEDFEEIVSFDQRKVTILIFGKNKTGSYSGYLTDPEFIDHTDFTFTPDQGETVKGAALMGLGKTAVLTVLDGSTMIYVFDRDGKQQNSFDCGEIIDGDTYAEIFASEDGFYIDANREFIAFVDPEGNYAGDVKLGGKYISGIAANSEGVTTVLLSDPDGSSLAELSETKLVNEKPCSDPVSYIRALCAGNEDSSLVIISGDAMFGLKDNEWVKLCDFMDNDFSADSISDIIVTGKNEFAAVIRSNGRSRLTLLTERDISELKARKVVKMAVMMGAGSDNITGKEEAKVFNSENDEYRVEIVNYGEKGPDPEDWGKALMEDILLGNAPDIVRFGDHFPINTFGAKESLFVDLYSLLDNDPGLSRDDFVEGFLEGFESDGKLLMVSSSFELSSVCIKDKFTDGLTEWNIDQLIDVYNNMPEGMVFNTLVEQDIRRGILTDLININEFVDYENAVCSFDSPEFIKAMKFVNDNKLGLTLEESSGFVSFKSGRDLYRNDKALLAQSHLSSFGSIRSVVKGQFNEPATFVGHPSQNGNGTYRPIGGGYGIMANSQNIEGAWEFLRYFLFETDQNPTNFSGLKEKYNEQLEYEMNLHSWTDPETGEEISLDYYWLGGDSDNKIPIDTFTAEEAGKYDAFVKESLKNSFVYDYHVIQIVNEELDAYFEGENSAEKAADIIQTRVTLYLSEHYQ